MKLEMNVFRQSLNNAQTTILPITQQQVENHAGVRNLKADSSMLYLNKAQGGKHVWSH
jgi:hypothetical protein